MKHQNFLREQQNVQYIHKVKLGKGEEGEHGVALQGAGHEEFACHSGQAAIQRERLKIESFL